MLAAVLGSLRNLRHESALHAALELLAHRQPAVRQEAAGLLGYLRRPETLGDLPRGPVGYRAQVRRQAVAALISRLRNLEIALERAIDGAARGPALEIKPQPRRPVDVVE